MRRRSNGQAEEVRPGNAGSAQLADTDACRATSRARKTQSSSP